MVESEWLPEAELGRLLDESVAGFDDVTIIVEPPTHRGGFDPAIASALISAAAAVIGPLILRVVDRLLAVEPKARIALTANDSGNTTVLVAEDNSQVRAQSIVEIVATGPVTVRIARDG